MKKASIQLSTNFIVVMVLTILVISMGFVIFGKLFDGLIDHTTPNIDQQCEDYIEIALREDDVGFCKTKLEVEKGEIAIAWLGVYNGFEHDVCYEIIDEEINPDEGVMGTLEVDALETIVKQREQKNILISIDTTQANRGTYFVKIGIYPRNIKADGSCENNNIEDESGNEIRESVKTLIVEVK